MYLASPFVLCLLGQAPQSCGRERSDETSVLQMLADGQDEAADAISLLGHLGGLKHALLYLQG